MIFSGNKTIEVKEYQNNSVTTKYAHLLSINNHNDINVNGWKLSIAIARALCSNQLNRREFYFDIIQSILNLSFLIHGQSNDLRLNSTRIHRLRDFSRTNKIGELGQGITWLYLEEESDYPFVADFNYFCEINGIHVPPNSSTPDFVSQDTNHSTKICLAESKGKELNSKTTIKKSLKKGLKQCDYGEILIKKKQPFKVAKKLVFCSEFSNENDPSNSNLHFTDPNKEIIEFSENELIYKLHYASWFYLIGDFSNVERLIKGRAINFDEKRFEKIELNKTSFWTIPFLNRFILENYISQLPIEIYPRFIINGINLKLGISVRVVDYLRSKKARKNELIESISESNYEIFRDGTLIYNLKRNKE